MTTKWLGANQQQNWRAMLTGTSALIAALNHDLEENAGLSLNEYEILVRLSEAPEHTLRMSVLAEGLVHSRSRITHTVRRMEQGGLVVREPSRCDGRGVDCRMTPEGYQLLQQVAPTHVASVRRRLVDVVTPSELATIGAAFERVTAQIAQDTSD